MRRSRRRREEIARSISEYAASGLSRAAFCQTHQLALATLARYLQRATVMAPAHDASFVAVELVKPNRSPESSVTLLLTSRLRF